MELSQPLNFDPTPKLKSSPLPILFISFNYDDKNCISCGDEYTKTPEFNQRYCQKCLLRYINEVNDINTYLDVTMKPKCSQRELTPHNIHEIFYFEQIYYREIFVGTIDTCKLCGKLRSERTLYGRIFVKSCSECYRISSGRIESTITKKLTPILHLPYWYSRNCIACWSTLKFMSNSKKACENCYIIYSGCRYCLTTNVIVGFTDQSQCVKCKRVSVIDIVNYRSGNSELDDFLYDMRSDIHSKLSNHITNITLTDNENIINSIRDTYRKQIKSVTTMMIWIPYSQITNMEQIAEGGFGIIYRATWKTNEDLTVIVKRLKNSQNIFKDFLNELKSNHGCYKLNHHIIRTFGFTKEPKSVDYMLVMEYASEGDLHKYLQKSFTQITWNKKYELQKSRILWQISDGLYTIHRSKFIHRDFHSGNILFNLTDNSRGDKQKIYINQQEYKIGDLGLSQSTSDASSNNEIYGVIPYIAPEIFNGGAFTKESDIYCFGMIMWELTTGCKPFANAEHDHILIYKIICGERPKITEDTPECFANLMKSCWHSDPQKRPSMKEIRNTLRGWSFNQKDSDQFDQAEDKRKKLINSKKLGPEFVERPHPKAVFTSRPLSSLISKVSSTNSSLSLGYVPKEHEFNISDKSNNKEYTSREYEFDVNVIDTQSLSLSNLNSVIQNFSTTQYLGAIYANSPINELNKEYYKFDIDNNESYFKEYTSKEYDFDIDIINTQSLSSPNLNSVIQKSPTNQHAEAIYVNRPISEPNFSNTTSRKRNIEELNIGTYGNEKYMKYIP